jgi:hypothetical protein
MYRLTPQGAQRATPTQEFTDTDMDAFVRRYLAMGPEKQANIDRVLAKKARPPQR